MIIERGRRVEAFLEARSALEEHRKSHSRALAKYLSREDPGFAGWSPLWTRSEFEAAFLREGSRLTRTIAKAEERMEFWMKFACEAGLEPLGWQNRDFWQPNSGAYPPSVEEAMINNAPEREILRWDSGVPVDLAGFDASIARRFTEHPEAFRGDWPADEAVYFPTPDVGPSESASCAALPDESQRLDQYAGPKPQGWTLRNEVSRRRRGNGHHVLSHFF